MVEPDDQTLHLLREIRTQIKELDGKVDDVHDDLAQRIKTFSKR